MSEILRSILHVNCECYWSPANFALFEWLNETRETCFRIAADPSDVNTWLRQVVSTPVRSVIAIIPFSKTNKYVIEISLTWYTSLKCDYKDCTSIILYTPEIYLTFSTVRNFMFILSLCFWRKIDWGLLPISRFHLWYLRMWTFLSPRNISLARLEH